MTTLNSSGQDLINDKVEMYVEQNQGDNNNKQNSTIDDNKAGTSQEKTNTTKEDIIAKLVSVLEELKAEKRESKDVIKNEGKKDSLNGDDKPGFKRKRPKLDDSDSDSSDEERYVYRINSPRKHQSSDSDSSLNSRKSYSSVSENLKEELSNILGRSYVVKLAKREKYSRDHERAKRFRKGHSRERSSSARRNSQDKNRSDQNYPEYNDYDSQYQQRRFTKVMEEKFSRYYAVMYAFSIMMDILRQDDIYTNN